MRTRTLTISFALLSVCSLAESAQAQAQDLDETTIAKLRSAVATGKDLNAHDQSAWHVTDALMALQPDVADKRILYVTERIDPVHVKTTFVLIEDKDVLVFFSGVVDGSTVVSTEDFTRDPNPPLATAEQVARADVLMTAREMFREGLCGQRPNYVVLPSQDDGVLDVYALVPETSSGVMQIGGHVRVSIDANGLPVPGATKAFSNTCLSMPEDPQAAMLFVTMPENIGDTPTEIHVFKSISHGIPIYVSTSRGLWAIDGARIQLLDAKAAN